MANEYVARLGLEGQEPVGPLPDIWGMIASAQRAEAAIGAGDVSVPPAAHRQEERRNPLSDPAEPKLSNLMEQHLIGANTRAIMGCMAVAVVLWPGIDRRGLLAVAQSRGAHENVAHTARVYLLDMPTTARHRCEGAPEGGALALINRVCVGEPKTPGPSRHQLVYAPAPQLIALAGRPRGTVSWLDTGLEELAMSCFEPPDLSKIVERQRKIEILATQQLHHGL